VVNNYTLIGRIVLQTILAEELYGRFKDKPAKELFSIGDLIAVGKFGIGTALIWYPTLKPNLLGRGVVWAGKPLAIGWGIGVVIGVPISHAIAGEEGVEDFLEVATLQVGWTEYNEAIQEGFGGWGGIPGALWDITGAPIGDWIGEEIVEPVGDWWNEGWREIDAGIAAAQVEIAKAKASVIEAGTGTVMWVGGKVGKGINIWENIAWKPWYIA